MNNLKRFLMYGLLAFSICATGCNSGGTKKKETSIETNITDYEKICKGKKYYVSTSGNDDNDGLSIDKPIKTLAKASTIKLEPGDGLFLKRGDEWKNEYLDFYNSGKEGNPVYLSSYGTGDKPLIRLAGMDTACVYIRNSADLIVSSLALGDAYGGIEISYNELLYGMNAPNGQKYAYDEAMERKNLVIEDIYAYNMASKYNSDEYQYNHTSFGVVIRSRNTSNKPYMLDGLQIRNCYFRNCNEGLNLVCHIGKKFDGGSSTGLIKNALIENNTAELCGQWGMHFSTISDAIMRYNTTCYTGQNANNFGSCAFLLVKCSNVLVDHLLINEHYRNIAQSYDGCGFDFEGGNINCSLVNSTIQNVDGCGVFIYNNNSGNNNIDFLMDNVTLINCGKNVQSSYCAGLYFVGDHTGKVSNCTFKNFKDVGQLDDITDGDVPAVLGNYNNIIFENIKEEQTNTGYEWDFSVDGNYKQFGKTYFYINGEKDPQEYGSTTDSISCKGGYLKAYFGKTDQYISGPDFINCYLNWATELKIELINKSTATKMKFEFDYTSKAGKESFEIPLPTGDSKMGVAVDLTSAIKTRRGAMKWFTLSLVDGTGEIDISKISITGGER